MIRILYRFNRNIALSAISSESETRRVDEMTDVISLILRPRPLAPNRFHLTLRRRARATMNGKAGATARSTTMSTIYLHRRTFLTPEQYIAGLTDFGPGRSKLFANSADAYLKVHYRGGAIADVTEGSGGVWERLHYNWSDPNRVVLTTTDSNLWGGKSGHTYTFTRRPTGTTDIDVVVVRKGKNWRGWMLGLVLQTIGRSVLEKAFENSVRVIELRNSSAQTSNPLGQPAMADME
jgi:hypothetical protein